MNHSPGFLSLVDRAKAQIRECTVDDLRGGLPALVIDVREDHEWAAGHIVGAVHLGRGVLERDIEAAVPDRSQPLVLYCGGGYRSALSALSLQEMGYTAVSSLAGGWKAWLAAGGPVTTGS